MIGFFVVNCVLVFCEGYRLPATVGSRTAAPTRSYNLIRTQDSANIIPGAQSIGLYRSQIQRSYTELFLNQLGDGSGDRMTGDRRSDLEDRTIEVPLFERVQRGLARLTEIIPKPILLTVVAVASGLLFFELSKTLLLLSLPLVVVLGGIQSIKEGIEEAAKGPRVYDTEVIESFIEDDIPPSRYQGEGWDSRQSASSSSNSLEELERQSRERSGRLAAIQRRISETSGDLRNAISTASSLRDKITSYVDKIDIAGAVITDATGVPPVKAKR